MSPEQAARTRDALARTLAAQQGLLVAQPAIVRRGSYSGRGLLGDNESFTIGDLDDRGYLAVEWWIMSAVAAANPEPRPGEGLTGLELDDGRHVPLPDALAACGRDLLGDGVARWPLIKLLDVGGAPVMPDFSATAESPPIPAHVHAGEIVNGYPVGPGKVEAYCFPPVDVPPYSRTLSNVVTRLGLRPGTTREQCTAALAAFGTSDAVYGLLNEFPATPYDGWTVPAGVLHAPGPWPTIEVQTPQDDFNFAAWRLGERLDEAARRQELQRMVLRGLPDVEAFVARLLDWETTTAVDFEARFRRPAVVLDEGRWGRRLRTFFDPFDGEALEVRPGEGWSSGADPRPRALVVWSGSGTVNGLRVDAAGCRELLAVAGASLDVRNDGDTTLMVFAFFPMTRPQAS
ncbi:MAG: hypothetical protein FJW23_06825 [Acidimicrobiia bacterium]|nr:hypothetical protein [Acidimicrobiia bacterium]